MTQQAVLFNKIEKLPPQYFGQVFDFVGYIEQKAKEAEALEKAKAERNAKEKAAFEKYADELNREMEDVLLDQVDIFEMGDCLEDDE